MRVLDIEGRFRSVPNAIQLRSLPAPLDGTILFVECGFLLVLFIDLMRSLHRFLYYWLRNAILHIFPYPLAFLRRIRNHTHYYPDLLLLTGSQDTDCPVVWQFPLFVATFQTGGQTNGQTSCSKHSMRAHGSRSKRRHPQTATKGMAITSTN